MKKHRVAVVQPFCPALLACRFKADDCNGDACSEYFRPKHDSLKTSKNINWASHHLAAAMGLLHLLLTCCCITASSSYINSSYRFMTVKMERYACRGALTGTRDATKTKNYVLGNRSCSDSRRYFECSRNGTMVGHFDCASDALIEEFAEGECFACNDYVFECDQIWFKGTEYDAKYFKPYCNSLTSDSAPSMTRRIIGLTSVLLSSVFF